MNRAPNETRTITPLKVPSRVVRVVCDLDGDKKQSFILFFYFGLYLIHLFIYLFVYFGGGRIWLVGWLVGWLGFMVYQPS